MRPQRLLSDQTCCPLYRESCRNRTQRSPEVTSRALRIKLFIISFTCCDQCAHFRVVRPHRRLHAAAPLQKLTEHWAFELSHDVFQYVMCMPCPARSSQRKEPYRASRLRWQNSGAGSGTWPLHEWVWGSGLSGSDVKIIFSF